MVSRLLGLVLLALFLLAMAGCGLVDEPVQEECGPEKETRSINVRFSMSPNKTGSSTLTRGSDGLLTRTDPEDHEEVPSDFIYEDAIDIFTKDFAIYAFNEEGTCSFSSITSEEEMTVFGSPTTGYLVNTYIANMEVDKLADNVTFTIVVLANLQSAGGNYPDVEVGTTTLSDLESTTGMNPVFSLPVTTGKDWYPGDVKEDGTTCFIPMYGRRTFTVPKTAFGDPEGGAQLYELGSVPLLRALAKVEIIDAIDKVEGQDYPGIESVSVFGFRQDGYLIPNDFTENTQVKNVTLPQNLVTVGEANAWLMKKLTGEKTIAYDENNNEIKKSVDFWRIYIPELSLAVSQPVFSVRLRSAADVYEDRTIRLADYSTPFSSKIMRNHIYGISVLNLNAAEGLYWTVCPWVLYGIDVPEFQ